MATHVQLTDSIQDSPASFPNELSPQWKALLAEARLAGLPDDQLQVVAENNGLDTYAVTAALENLSNEACYAAALRTVQRWKKLKSVLSIRKSLSSLAQGSGIIERRNSVSRGEFLERYYVANKPVIFTDLLADSFAYQYWTPEHLSSTCGEVTVLRSWPADLPTLVMR
jgi:hypothetical protein